MNCSANLFIENSNTSNIVFPEQIRSLITPSGHLPEGLSSPMPLSHDAITALAPDQASLKAANGLTKAKKWPLREMSEADQLVWGECQGSGANPYRTVFDAGNHSYKCTCPSRKFPCKHVLALMWMFVDDPSPFQPGNVPDWVSDWLGRRRTTGSQPVTKPGPGADGKSLYAAKLQEPEKPADPKAEARRQAAAQKRAKETEAALLAATDELQQWIADQLRTGLSGFLEDITDRCRSIAARLVDGKAQALAGRLDELPAKILPLSGEERLETVVRELGKIVILVRAWRADPSDPELRRMVATSETRESLFEAKAAEKVSSRWEVLGEEIVTRRDGMVSQATWLMNLAEGPPFALLLDFFPATLGRRSGSFVMGEQFEAELVFYPARHPLRAVLGERKPGTLEQWPWPEAHGHDPLKLFLDAQDTSPWMTRCPVLLPPGRFCHDTKESWWQSTDGHHSLPVATKPLPHLAGMDLHSSVGLWDGQRLSLLSAQTNWGRIQLNG